jgi:hypothetical protein
MLSMFSGAVKFNQYIGDWDTSNVEDMGSVFFRATAFNQDISGWNTLSVGGMGNIFQEAVSFNQDLSQWDIQNVANFTNMFSGAQTFQQDLCQWGKIITLDDVLVENMFEFTKCQSTMDPILESFPVGPFCAPCAGNITRSNP